MNETLNIQEAIANLRSSITEATNSFDEMIYNPDNEYNTPHWLIENCFLQLLTVLEAMGLNELRKMVVDEYSVIKTSKEGFVKVAMGPEEPYSVCLSRIRQFLLSLELFYPNARSTRITKDLLQIIRDIHYTITDKALYLKMFPKMRRMFISESKEYSNVYSRI